MPLTIEEYKTIEEFASRFLVTPKNVEKFQEIEAEIRRQIDAKLSSSNVVLKHNAVTTEADSAERKANIGWPEYEI